MNSYGYIKVAAVVPEVKVADCGFNTERIIEMMQQAAELQGAGENLPAPMEEPAEPDADEPGRAPAFPLFQMFRRNPGQEQAEKPGKKQDKKKKHLQAV